MVVLSLQKLARDPRYNVTEAFAPPLATLFAQNAICGCFGTSSAVHVVSGGIVVSKQIDLHFA